MKGMVRRMKSQVSRSRAIAVHQIDEFRIRRVMRISGAESRYVISRNGYGTYCVPRGSSHRPAARKILAGRIYEPRTIDFITKNCGRGDVVHAGTFFGDFLPALSKSLANGALVWAFEPNPENFKCAGCTIFLNGLENVQLRHTALGSDDGQVLLRTEDARGRSLGGASKVVDENPDEGSDRCVAVSVGPLDNLIPTDRDVSVIQLDVEGYEIEALSGALGIIRRCRPILILEELGKTRLADNAWFREHILGLGYRFLRPLHGNAVFKVGS